jgi:hypothetical protein
VAAEQIDEVSAVDRIADGLTKPRRRTALHGVNPTNNVNGAPVRTWSMGRAQDGQVLRSRLVDHDIEVAVPVGGTHPPGLGEPP